MSGAMLQALFEFSRIDVLAVVQFFVALYLSLSVHEASHAWMANRCGDDTARLMGRMTLNPLAHIDPIGTVLMPALMVMCVGFPLIGWAKPVPVNPLRFRNMRRGEILVSLAGPVSNLLLAAAALVVCWVALWLIKGQGQLGDTLLLFPERLLMLNLVLCVFNLIPIPPLDGSHVLGTFLSRQAASKYERMLMPPFNFIVLLFVVVPLLGPLFGLMQTAALYAIFIW
jgi:Zn-dependent protease